MGTYSAEYDTSDLLLDFLRLFCTCSKSIKVLRTAEQSSTHIGYQHQVTFQKYYITKQLPVSMLHNLSSVAGMDVTEWPV